MSNEPYYNFAVVEAISRRFRELQQEEAKKQNGGIVDAENMTVYDDCPDSIKEFYRVLARYVLGRFESAIMALKFYGLEENWIEVVDNSVVQQKNVFDDMGEKARDVLQKIGYDT